MRWDALNAAIERIRAGIAEDPAAAREEIERLREKAGPEMRARLWGLEVVARRYQGDLEGALRAYGHGHKLRTRSALARAELEASVVHVHIARQDLAAAAGAADRAVAAIEPEALAPPPGRSARMARQVRTMYGAALVARVQAGGFPDSPRPATVGDVLEAFPWIDPRHAPRVYFAAVSGLAGVLTRDAASPEDLRAALELEEEAQRLLRRRRVQACHPHRAQLRVIKALACAKLGAIARAEEILEKRVIPDLRAAGLDAVADTAVGWLAWIVAERAGQVGRAQYLRRRHGLAPAEPAPPVVDDPNDPIGF